MPQNTSLRALLAIALAGMAVASGCISISETLTPASTNPLGDALNLVQLLDEGGFSMDVPVDVYLVGFDAATAETLQERLTPEPVDHAAGSFPRSFPPDPDAPFMGWEEWRAPAQPRAVFTVIDLDDAFEAAFFTAAADWRITGSDHNAYDANAAETHLAREIPAATGRSLDPNTPAFVILHAGDNLGADHAWRYTYTHGHLEPVRAFGEREALLAYDVSAIPDPYVVREPSTTGRVFQTIYGPSTVNEYNKPMEASGEKTVNLLTDLTVDAAHYRFLKGPIYPISTKPCHHVTLLFAVHQTAMTEQLPDFKKANEYVDVAGLTSAFENLTGGEVHVELKTMMLPVDDPVLDGLSRQAATTVTLDALRWYVDENWEKFVTPVDGCEEYLSLLLLADATSETRQFGGIGMYDVKRSHRISFSIVTELSRMRKEYTGPGEDILSTRDPTDAWNYVNLLFSHETGHLFGQHHPQHLSKTEQPSPVNSAFESVWSVMSYETYTRTIDFGKNDYAQWNRNRAGYTIKDAMALDLQDTPEFQDAIRHLGMGHWNMAHLTLEERVHKADGHEHELPDYHVRGEHRHAWG